ncbi:WD40 repeat-like protein, partial [Sistotremastrum suecicum HHB10207 ss-3]
VWDTHTQLRLFHIITEHAETCTCLIYSPDGELIISGSHDMTLKMWSAQNGEEKLLPRRSKDGQKHEAPISSLAYDPLGRYFISGDADGMIYSW